jgi:glyoxylase-like metal-dependent hydrolase (beta-lactamase superfamily II)
MLEKVTDRIYYMRNEDDTDRPALGLVKGDNCCMIIDAGNSPQHAKEFKELIKGMGLPPVKYLVVTHHHWDHIFGLKEWDVVTIANEKTCDYINTYCKMGYDDISLEEAKENGVFSEASIRCMKRELTDRDHFTPCNAAVSFHDRLKIDLGGITCIIRQIESPHTDDSTIIYVPEENTLFLGDCVYGRTKNGKFYLDDISLFLMMDIIEENYVCKYYLCSHESICSSEEMTSFWQQLRDCYSLTKECANLTEAMTEYKNRYGKEVSDDDLFFMRGFGIKE